MGVHCEINLFQHTDGVYVPGSTVSGIIRYAVDEVTEFKKITLSLKGNGRLFLQDLSKRRRNHTMSTYRRSEEYVDIENIVQDSDKVSEKATPLPIGAYDVPFTFTLPQNLPPSLQYYKKNVQYRIRCDIKYYISIKFERIELFKFASKMTKEITVVSGIKPRLPMEPTILGEQKKILQIIPRKPNVVNIKANIESCVISPGSKVNFKYEIFNHTNLNLKSVETKLIEVYTFTTIGQSKAKITEDVKDTDSKCGSINSGVSSSLDVTINLPSNLGSIENSNLVSRDYYVQITTEIPFPHWNAHLLIPLQIGDCNESRSQVDNPPPCYWEAMAEDKKQGRENTDGADDDDNKSDVE